MFSYDNPVDRMIQRFKYQGDLRMGRLLGYLFAEYAMGVITKRQWQFEVIIPVPLHPQGLFKRGFNQTLEMVRALSRTLKIPYDATGLQKTRGGASQMGLSKQARQINRLGDYQVVGCNKYRRILIVDDVLTTGATLNAILDALCERTESNLQCVYFLGLARQI
jgi:ComF family protein